MKYDAYKKRLLRARKAAEKKLREAGYVSFEIDDPSYPASLIALDPETERAKLVRICLTETELSYLGKLKKAEIRTEIWFRQPGETSFQIIKI
ncbi:MAG: hypothetical protein QHH14_11360 [Clostridiales bacterium]|jgi:tRNA(Ile2) C34 agmatinyltransferase TiaS|nr:hypothetical protein [Clostridiales bacterium]